jgi:hypothetical protein
MSKDSKVARTSRNLLSLIFIGFLLSACALGTDRVKLHDPLIYKPAEEGGTKAAYAGVPEVKPITVEKIQMVIKKVEDKRPDTSRIGAKKNTYGMKTGSVDVEEGIVFLELFTKNLINCFASAGYEIIPINKYEGGSTIDKERARGLVEAEVKIFWVTFIPGFAVVDASSIVTFSVKLFDPEMKREIWSGIFDGKGKVSGMAVTRGMYEKSINSAYAEAMRNFYTAISDENFKNMLKK